MLCLCMHAVDAMCKSKALCRYQWFGNEAARLSGCVSACRLPADFREFGAAKSCSERHALNPFQVLQQSVCIRSIKMPFNASASLLALHFRPLSLLLHFPFCLYPTLTCHLFTPLPLSQTSCGAGHCWMVYWQSDNADESSWAFRSVRNDVETLLCLHLAGTSFHFTSQRIEFTLASVRLSDERF